MKRNDKDKDKDKDNDKDKDEQYSAPLATEVKERPAYRTNRTKEVVQPFENTYFFGFGGMRKTSKESYSRYALFIRTITRELNAFGIHISNNGYSYIIDSVLLIIDRRSLDLKLNTDIYPAVAAKYGF